MKQNQIMFTREPVDWLRVPVLAVSERVRPLPTDAQAFGQICRTDGALLIHMVAKEDPVLAREQGPLAMPCKDSCLEFFLRPSERELRYFNFEWNPNGCLYLGIGSGPADLMRIVPSQVQLETLFCPVVNRTSEGWEVFFRIPYSFIRRFFPDFEVLEGAAVYANFYKCGDDLPKPHYLAWNPITREGKYLFHTPQEFGRLELV